MSRLRCLACMQCSLHPLDTRKAVVCSGDFTSAWDALGPHIYSLALRGAYLPHQLPESWAQTLPNVQHISIKAVNLTGRGLWLCLGQLLATTLQSAAAAGEQYSACLVAGTFPNEWARPGAFPHLREIWLGSNPELTGRPPACGSAGPMPPHILAFLQLCPLVVSQCWC